MTEVYVEVLVCSPLKLVLRGTLDVASSGESEADKCELGYFYANFMSSSFHLRLLAERLSETANSSDGGLG